jgi:site-specific DNA-methyltransferase (adenine-specific)
LGSQEFTLVNHEFKSDVPQHGDALTLLQALPDGCSPLVFFDPQFRSVLDKLAFGNEGVGRQRARVALPQMTEDYTDQCSREIARVLRPSGYSMTWTDTFNLCAGHHLRVGGVLSCVDLIAWDNGRIGMGYRCRRRGSYLLISQRPPLKAKATWLDHGIPDRWVEKIDRRIHPHAKPAGLIGRLIGAVTAPGDLVVDPAAGSFVVMHAAHELGRRFIGCDISFAGVDYDSTTDFSRSIDAAYAAIRERKANGGPGWTPGEAAGEDDGPEGAP